MVSESSGDISVAETQEQAQGYVSFKQATTGEVEVRTGVLQNRRWKQENGSILLFDDFNVDFLARTEVRLTLTGTDITFEDGKELEFRDGKVSSESQFNRWWDQLPFQWARKMHEFCLEMNPMWDMSKRD